MAQAMERNQNRSESRESHAGPFTGFHEGWISLALHLVIVFITANSVVRIEQSDRNTVLIPMAAGGLLLGYALARFPHLDAFSHIAALAGGVLGAFTLAAISLDGIGSVWSSRGRSIYDLGYRFVEAQINRGNSGLAEDELLVVIGVTLWLVAYSSAWMLCRRHWLLPALILPAVLLFINLRFEEQDSTIALGCFAFAALIMAARHQAYVRQLEWSRRRIPSPVGLPSRFTTAGSMIAVATLLMGTLLPNQLPAGVVDSVADQVVSQWDRVASQLDSVGDPPASQVGENEGFGSFPDSFKIGGEFKPSKDEVASLEATQPLYLAVRRYDKYTGTGWASDVDSTFRMDGEGESVSATSVTFSENQYVPVSDEVNAERNLRAGVVTLLKPTDGLLYTTDSFVGSTLPSVAVLGWKQISELRINVDEVSIASLPVDLQGLVIMLRESEFTADPETGKPVVRDSQQSFAIEQERSRLLSYPVNTTLSYDETGDVVVTVSGRLPNYDDIEAIFSNKPVSAQERYRVTGSESLADADQLAEAGSNYPDWVIQRYLQLPTSVTVETVQLTLNVIEAAGAVTPFDKAWAIQEYLHNTYPYTLDSEDTPSGRDAVDFFLFGKQMGKCDDYASSMIVMLRSQGIPARLVSGFRAGSEVDSFGDYIYREEQLHTWVEVFFPSYGWIPFEPTQGQEPFDYSQEPEALQTETPDTTETIQPTPTVVALPTMEATPEATPVISAVKPDETSFSNPLASGVGLLSAIVLGVIVLFAAIAFSLWILSLRGLRPGAALFTRVMRVGRLWGVQSSATMTPAEYAAAFGQSVPKASGAANYVADLYTAETYGGVEISSEAQRSGREAWKTVRANISGWRPWKRRK